LYDPTSHITQLGIWKFNEIQIIDKDLFNKYIKKTEYPCNLWSSNFAYLWAISQSNLRTILWKIIDDMLVTFDYSHKGSLYLYCLPYGEGNCEKVLDVLLKCMQYCLDFNKQDIDKSPLRMINEEGLEFLRKSSRFDKYFKLDTWRGIERHFDVKKLILLAGKDFANVRSGVNKFRKDNPSAIVSLYEPKDYDELIRLDDSWRKSSGKKYSKIFDSVYYQELIKHCVELNQIILIIRIENVIVGMISGCVLSSKQAWGSVVKFEAGIQGLSETLLIEFVKELNRISPNIELLNVGSDLGPGGLRDYKLKFRPVLSLKRYQVYFKDNYKLKIIAK
jgi:hypothetical protein